nr:squalene/phytoene synthase family protein [Haloplasma contractile]
MSSPYCYIVTSNVLLMIIPLLLPKNYLHLQKYSIKLGYAMQLTNILGDIGKDLGHGRFYIPKELMKQDCYTEQELKQYIIIDSFINLFEHLAVKVELFFK